MNFSRTAARIIGGAAMAAVPSETNDTTRDAKQARGRGLFLLPGAQETGLPETGFLVIQSRRENPTIIPVHTFDKHLLSSCSCEPAPRLLTASELPSVAKTPAGSVKPELLSTLTFK